MWSERKQDRNIYVMHNPNFCEAAYEKEKDKENT